MQFLRRLLQYLQPWREPVDKHVKDQHGSVSTDQPAVRPFSELAKLSTSSVTAKPHTQNTDKPASPPSKHAPANEPEEAFASASSSMTKRSKQAAASDDPKLEHKLVVDPATGRIIKGFRLKVVPDLPVQDLSKLTSLPAPRTIWACHTKTKHVLLANCPPHSGFDYTGAERSTADRRRLKPWIKLRRGRGDRTHLIPFGYHGVEHSPWLLVEWPSASNRGELNEYEKLAKAANRRRAIYWHVSLEKEGKGMNSVVVWRYAIYDATTGRLLLKPFTIAKHCAFDWQ